MKALRTTVLAGLALTVAACASAPPAGRAEATQKCVDILVAHNPSWTYPSEKDMQDYKALFERVLGLDDIRPLSVAEMKCTKAGLTPDYLQQLSKEYPPQN